MEQKRAIVEEYAAAAWGSRGAVLRRHGVTYRMVGIWTSYRDAGVLETGLRKGWQVRMTPRKENAEIRRLQAQVARLEAEVDQARRERVVAEDALEALGKASALLQAMLQSAEPSQPSESSLPPASST